MSPECSGPDPGECSPLGRTQIPACSEGMAYGQNRMEGARSSERPTFGPFLCSPSQTSQSPEEQNRLRCLGSSVPIQAMEAAKRPRTAWLPTSLGHQNVPTCTLRVKLGLWAERPSAIEENQGAFLVQWSIAFPSCTCPSPDCWCPPAIPHEGYLKRLESLPRNRAALASLPLPDSPRRTL